MLLIAYRAQRRRFAPLLCRLNLYTCTRAARPCTSNMAAIPVESRNVMSLSALGVPPEAISFKCVPGERASCGPGRGMRLFVAAQPCLFAQLNPGHVTPWA